MYDRAKYDELKAVKERRVEDLQGREIHIE